MWLVWYIITHVVRTIAEYFEIGQRLYPERGPRVTERSRNSDPIISFPLISISPSARNFFREKKRAEQAREEGGGGRTSDVAGNYGGNSRRRTTEEGENKTPGFYKRFWNCVRLGHETRRRGGGGDKEKEGGSARTGRDGRKSKLGVGIYRNVLSRGAKRGMARIFLPWKIKCVQPWSSYLITSVARVWEPCQHFRRRRKRRLRFKGRYPKVCIFVWSSMCDSRGSRDTQT